MNPTLIIEILEALPAFMQSVPRVLTLIERYLNWAKANDQNKWLDGLEGGMDKLEKAQTAQDKIDAARALDDSIRHIR